MKDFIFGDPTDSAYLTNKQGKDKETTAGRSRLAEIDIDRTVPIHEKPLV